MPTLKTAVSAFVAISMAGASPIYAQLGDRYVVGADIAKAAFPRPFQRQRAVQRA
jgi:hypothetical protein